MSSIAEAFSTIDRANFIPENFKYMSGADMPLPIGYSQTISQPTTVEMMLEWLDAQPDEKVLDVGSGSGWTTALLSIIVGPKGHVYAVERISELVECGRENVERLGMRNVSFHQAGKEFGLPAEAPFNRILVSASADKLPQTLIDQLKPGGKLVIPVHNSIFEIYKNPDCGIESTEHPGFVFVPLL
ncbi:MAG TPA: protein-L-isoaspartate O-methyltransferase [Candidatus Saccharimonadales bacterium]|nr:protein-L-isoaspartate O-methyltransferase [Candidatus Saccharimonadales bacterium]